ncbi:hypothetical protein Btru_000802 [Bulinus truncatus]|nr:hypothetical protein Btru_000802 [Bulinus truncatus]
MSNTNGGGLQTPPVAAPRIQKPVKRKERASAKQKLLQQQEQQRHLQQEIQQQLKLQQQTAPKKDQAKNSPSARKGCSTCCYSSCCCSSGSEDSKARDSINEADDDATHIASLSNNQTQSSSSICCGCCCFSKRRRKLKQLGNPQSKGGGGGARDKSTSRCRRCCRKLTAFIFSHVGLCSLVVAYSIMGGFLFQWLEAGDEKETRIGVSMTRSESVEKLWNMTSEFNILRQANWTVEADRILREFQSDLYRSVKERGWDGRDERTEDMMWSFSGSLLYSVTGGGNQIKRSGPLPSHRQPLGHWVTTEVVTVSGHPLVLAVRMSFTASSGVLVFTSIATYQTADQSTSSRMTACIAK